MIEIKERKLKTRKRTIAQILRKAYTRHCHDRATMRALRVYLPVAHGAS